MHSTMHSTMHNRTMGDAYSVEELSPELAMTIEGGGPILTAIVSQLVSYTINNAGELVKGFADGWNAYGH